MLKYSEFLNESKFFKLKDYLESFVYFLNKITDKVTDLKIVQHNSETEEDSNTTTFTNLDSDKFALITFDIEGKNHVMKVMENDGETYYVFNDKDYQISHMPLSDGGKSGEDFSNALKDVLTLEGEELIKKLEYLNRPITSNTLSKTIVINPSKVDTSAYLHINNGGITAKAEEDLTTSPYGEHSMLNLVISAHHFGVQTNEIRIPASDEFLCDLEILIKQMRDQLKEKKYTIDF